VTAWPFTGVPREVRPITRAREEIRDSTRRRPPGAEPPRLPAPEGIGDRHRPIMRARAAVGSEARSVCDRPLSRE
jgi:hypothetical protein